MAENQNNKIGGPWWKEGVRLMSNVSTWIVVPVILALVVGKFLDKRLGTEPLILLVCVGVSFLVSAYGIVKTVKEYTKNLKI